jgi:glycosyltransferase involved in cell wall biosynthesis
MIKNTKVIVATIMTNVVKNKYWPTSRHSLTSFSNTEYVDEVLVVDGGSTDDTVKEHSNISNKIKFLSGPKWNTDDLSDKNFINQCNVIYDYCNNLNEDVILIFECADVFFTDSFREECKEVIFKMLEGSYDFCVLPYAKMINPWICIKYSYMQNCNSFYNICITRFDKTDQVWKNGLINDGVVNNPSRALKKLIHTWKTTVVSYETWNFDKEQFSKKIKSHYNWDSNLSIDDTIKKMYYWKLQSLPTSIIDLKDHPKEAINVLKSLKEDHLGFSLFGHIKPILSYNDFIKQMESL